MGFNSGFKGLMVMCRSRWPCGVRRGSAAVRLLGLRSSDPTECGVSEWDLKASTMWRPKPTKAVGPWKNNNNVSELYERCPLQTSGEDVEPDIFVVSYVYWPTKPRRSRNHCCNGYATTHSLCTAELRPTVNNTKILIVAWKCFYYEFMSPATPQRTLVFT